MGMMDVIEMWNVWVVLLKVIALAIGMLGVFGIAWILVNREDNYDIDEHSEFRDKGRR